MELQKVGINTGQVIGDFLYGSCVKFNGLFKMNINTGEMFFLDFFPKEEYAERALFKESYVYKNYVIFIPQSASAIVAYNIDAKEFFRFELGEKTPCCSCLVDSTIWIFPVWGHEKIWSFDLDTFELKQFINPKWKNITIQRVVYYNNAFWAANCKTNTVLKVDSISLDVHELTLNCPKIYVLSGAGTGLWLITENSEEIILWNPDTNEMVGKTLERTDNQNGQIYIDVVETKNRIIAVPLEMVPIMKLEGKEEKFKEIYKYPSEFQILDKRRSPFAPASCVKTRNGWCILPCNVSHVIFIDNEQNDVRFVETTFVKPEKEQDIRFKYLQSLKKRIIIEYSDITLSEYIQMIDEQVSSDVEKSKYVGREIISRI